MEGMTFTTLALVRHGQTDWNAQRRLQGSTDIPLNDVGRGQARDAVAVLQDYQWDAVVSSPLSRAAETANLIAAGLGLSVDRRVPELAERSFDSAEGPQAALNWKHCARLMAVSAAQKARTRRPLAGWPRWKHWPRSSAAAASWSSPTARSSG